MEKYTSDNILHVIKSDIEYLQFKILNKYNNKLKHCITLKHRRDNNQLLTFRKMSKLGKLYANNNFKLICSKLNINNLDICKGTQNHTDNILIVNNENKSKYRYENNNLEEYDAYVTGIKNTGSLVITADCNPIIIYDPVKNVVSNIHSGWKGTVKRIYIKAIKTMINEFNCNLTDIIVCIGPSINKCCFCSRDIEFKKQFLEIWPFEEEYIITKENGYFYIDLPYVIKRDLQDIGILNENIVLSNICTVCNNEDFFSYRISKKNGEEDYETMATIVNLI